MSVGHMIDYVQIPRHLSIPMDFNHVRTYNTSIGTHVNYSKFKYIYKNTKTGCQINV